MCVTLELPATFRSVLKVLSLSLRFKKVALLGLCIVNEKFDFQVGLELPKFGNPILIISALEQWSVTVCALYILF